MAEWALVVFDVLVAFGLLWVGWRVIREPDAFRAVVLFITLGLLSALAWARLHAPDLALAEAAIGAGITGALLLDALGGLRRGRKTSGGQAQGGAHYAGWGVAVLAAGLLVVVVAVVIGVESAGLGAAVTGAMSPETVANPVTFVLLALRGWDTLLELAVMLAALTGVLIVRHEGRDRSSVAPLPPSIVMLALGALMVPAMALMGGYLYWSGSAHPGGAFQGGALAAAAGILLVMAGRMDMPPSQHLGARCAVLIGVGGMLAVGAYTALVGDGFLDLPASQHYVLVLLMEAGIAVATAATLALLFCAARMPGGPHRIRGA